MAFLAGRTHYCLAGAWHGTWLGEEIVAGEKPDIQDALC